MGLLSLGKVQLPTRGGFSFADVKPSTQGELQYLCSFEDTIDAVFSWADIQAALSDDVKPLFPE